MSLSFEEMQEVVSKLKFKDWIFHLGGKDEARPWLQIQFWDKDLRTGKPELQKCRKHRLTEHMVRSEIIRTAHKALHIAMEHEVDEQFSYDGVILYHPHFDLDALVEFAKKRKISVRP